MSDRVTISMQDGVADVRLNRPDKLNALDGAMFQALAEAGESLKDDRSVRAVVLSGEGRGFCAGLDFGSFQAMAGGGDGERAGADSTDNGNAEFDERPAKADPSSDGGNLGAIGEVSGRITHLGQQAAWVWAEVPVPVIAAIWGPALGGGFQIACGADIRIVAPDAKLSVMEVKWGLVPDMTGTWQLPRLVGIDVAKELVFTARTISGEEAGRIGLATRVSDTPFDDAMALATEIASKSPDAVRAAKRLMEKAGSIDVAEQFAMERAEIGALIGRPNQVEAVMAGFEKRPGNFADPA